MIKQFCKIGCILYGHNWGDQEAGEGVTDPCKVTRVEGREGYRGRPSWSLCGETRVMFGKDEERSRGQVKHSQSVW
jgi:hypothetical protein